MAQIPRQQSDAERLKSLSPTGQPVETLKNPSPARQPAEALKSPNGLLRAVSNFKQRISNFLRRSASSFMQNLRSLFSRSKKVSRSKKGKDTSGDLAALAKQPVVSPQVAKSPSGSPQLSAAKEKPAAPLSAPPPARPPSGSPPMAQGALADLLSQLSAAKERLPAPPPTVRPDLPMESSDVAMAFNPHASKTWRDTPSDDDTDVTGGEPAQLELDAAAKDRHPSPTELLPAIPASLDAEGRETRLSLLSEGIGVAASLVDSIQAHPREAPEEKEEVQTRRPGGQ